jgi:hypothetical protein
MVIRGKFIALKVYIKLLRIITNTGITLILNTGVLHGWMRIAVRITNLLSFIEEEKETVRICNSLQVMPLVNDGDGSQTQACLLWSTHFLPPQWTSGAGTMSHSSAFKIATHCYRKPLNHKNIC